MFAAIAAAQKQINLESYILEDVVLNNTKLFDLLIRKRQDGVQVNVIHDSVGSSRTPKELFTRLAAAGVNTCEFNPVKTRFWRLNHRDHRKILVVDGRIAFTGGINLSREYSSGSLGRRKKTNLDKLADGWRDTHIAVSGPAVNEFQRLFVDTWRRQNCSKLVGMPLPTSKPSASGNKTVRIIASSPDNKPSAMYLALLAAIDSAEHSIYITMAYFVPDPATVSALRRAAQRGVDVQLILPGFSDFAIVFHAGRSHYDELLEAGIKIYEQRAALLHAKTAVIDGVWSTIGSTNMDWRSYLHNDEVNLVVLGADMARSMLTLFEADKQEATQIEASAWAKRGGKNKLKEWFARRWEYLL
jgi:cardiolipin synthase